MQRLDGGIHVDLPIGEPLEDFRALLLFPQGPQLGLFVQAQGCEGGVQHIFHRGVADAQGALHLFNRAPAPQECLHKLQVLLLQPAEPAGGELPGELCPAVGAAQLRHQHTFPAHRALGRGVEIFLFHISHPFCWILVAL